MVGLALIIVEIIVFGVILGVPDWVYPPLWATLVAWIGGTLVMCVMMIVEVIARMRGKPATFGIATLGGRSIGDVRADRADRADHESYSTQREGREVSGRLRRRRSRSGQRRRRR